MWSAQLPQGNARRPISSAAYGSHYNQPSLLSQGGGSGPWDPRRNPFGARPVTTQLPQDATRSLRNSAVGPSIFAAPWVPGGAAGGGKPHERQDRLLAPASAGGPRNGLVMTFPPRSAAANRMEQQLARAGALGQLVPQGGASFQRAHTALSLPPGSQLQQQHHQHLPQLQPQPPSQPPSTGQSPLRALGRPPTTPPRTPGPPVGMAAAGRYLQGTYPGKAANQDSYVMQELRPFQGGGLGEGGGATDDLTCSAGGDAIIGVYDGHGGKEVRANPAPLARPGI